MRRCERCGGRICAELGDQTCWWCVRGKKPPSDVAIPPVTLEEIGRLFDTAIDLEAL